jgi:hypothetical protein
MRYSIHNHRVAAWLRHLDRANLHELSPNPVDLHRVDPLHEGSWERILLPKQDTNLLHRKSSTAKY